MRNAIFGILVSLACFARGENWPQFRGPTGQGISAEAGLPVTWSATENVAWRTEVPGEGWSSPVVWEKQAFVTATTAKGTSAHVVALDRDTGKVQWDVEVFQQPTPRKQPQNSYATSTPVTDGKFVYAVFGSGHAAAVACADGKVAWTNTAETFYSQHGLGSSPILYKDLLILPWDHSVKGGPEPRIGWQIPWDKSYVLALDAGTGKERYRAKRGMTRIAHMTPRVVEVEAKPQLISAAGDAIEAFDPETGARLWWVESGGEGTTPSPVFGEGMVFASSGFPTPLPDKKIYAALRAFRLGGAGDVTKANFAWEHTKGVPTLASPLYHDGLVYTVAEDGTFQCLQAADGKVVYSEKLAKPAGYSASPVYGDGKIYLLNGSGETTVVQAGREFKQLARNKVGEGEKAQASMAVSGARLFIRTDKAVYCVKAP